MLDGWYCRSIANQQSSGAEANEQDDDLEDAANNGAAGAGGNGGGGGGDSGSEDESQAVTMSHNAINQRVDYRAQYSGLKKKLKFLLYENEFFQDALRSSQRRLLKVTRDRSFLLDRLVQYEKTEATTSESDDTETSEDETHRETKRRKHDIAAPSTIPVIPPILQSPGVTISFAPRPPPTVQPKQRKKQLPPKKQTTVAAIAAPSTTFRTQSVIPSNTAIVQSDGHMTAEEVERHLQSRQPLMELVPERAPPTVPTEMFSNEPSLDSESNDPMEASPIDIGGDECLSVDY